MTPAELRQIRTHLNLDEVTFALELGYNGSERNLKELIRQYERGKKAPIPTYIARLAYLLQGHFEEDGTFPDWPPSCWPNPPKPSGEKE